MTRRWGRRLGLTAVAAAAGAVLIGGASFAIFDSGAVTQPNSFAGGTVVVDAPAAATCTVTGLMPETGGSCAPYTVTYSGGSTLEGWIGLAVGIRSTGSGSGPALYQGTDKGLEIAVSDGNSGQQFPVTGLSCNVAKTSCSTANPPVQWVTDGGSLTSPNAIDCTSLVGTIPGLDADCSVSGGWSDTFTVDYYMSSDSSDVLDNSTADITLSAYAVQQSNDPLFNCQPTLGWGSAGVSAVGCAPSTIAAYCGYIGGGTSGVAMGCSPGYWDTTEPNGWKLIGLGDSLLQPLVVGGPSPNPEITVTTKSDLLGLMQGSGDACPTDFGGDCANLTSSLAQNVQNFNQLVRYSIALYYNDHFVWGNTSGVTLGQLGCSSYDETAAGFTGTTTVGDVLGAAEALIGNSFHSGGTSASQAEAMYGLIGDCMANG